MYEKKATVYVNGRDRKFHVDFERLIKENMVLTPDSDWHYKIEYMTEYVPTDRMKITFCVDNKMQIFPFPEDLRRERVYEMDVEHARELYRILTRDDDPTYWFALDMASYFSK